MSTVITSKAQEDREEALLAVAALAGFPVIILTVVGSVAAIGAWTAFVVYKLYGWFVVPLGAPVINWWHAWGLMLILNVLTLKPTDVPSKGWKDSVAKLIGKVLGMATVLLIGWLIHGQI